MFVIATAGHVDHGKSTLIRALTGMEPDRWAEEKRRGMTIDLGYAWTGLPGGGTIAFVDVPGHHRFIGNMLAGVGPVPAVMLVIAADEGWCRQTAEHVSALDALGVRHGVLAVTRSDLGDADLAIEEARDHLAPTGLATMEAVAVSGVTGEGLERLLAALERMTASLPTPPATGATRLWVDRVFTVRGAGTVVTGTLATGTIAVGDELCLTPSGRRVRVRNLESLKATVDRATAVSRVAVNLRGLKTDEVRRGHALVTPGGWAEVTVMDVRLVNPDDPPAQPIVHVGSAMAPARLRMFGDDWARLTLSTPLPLHVGERVLLRDTGRRHIVAGAVVLDVDPPSLNRIKAAKRIEQLAAMPDMPDAAAEIRRREAAHRDRLAAAGILSPDAPPPAGTIPIADWLVHESTWDRWKTALITAVDRQAAENPLAPGLPREQAARTIGLPDSRLLDQLTDSAGLVRDGDGVHRPDAVPTFPPDVEKALAEVRNKLEADPFAALEAAELTQLGLSRIHLAAADKAGMLLRITDGVFLLPDAISEAFSRIAALPQPFTLSEGRRALGTTRRVAVPLLEHLDRQGLTRRIDGDRRSVRVMEDREEVAS